jgi:hypothetical protein
MSGILRIKGASSGYIELTAPDSGTNTTINTGLLVYKDSANGTITSTSTNDISEGSNLYYTTARFDSDFATKDTHDSAAVQAQIDSAAVTLTGNQTVAGIKTFSDSANFTGGHLRVYNNTDSEEQILIAEVSGGYSNGAGVSLRRDGTEMGRINADYFDGMTFYVTDGSGGAATQKARLSTGGSFVIGENEAPYNAFSVRDSDMGFEVNPNASKEVRLNAYDRGNTVFKTMALQADPVVIRPGGANGVGYTTIDNDGIKFNSDTAAANGLDDYEEGTFTPQMYHISGTPTYTYQEGRYTKIGDVVHAHGIIGVSNSTSLGGAVGITNLPFSIARAGSYGYTMGSVSDGSGFTFPVGNGFYTLYLQTSGNNAIFVGVGTNAGVVNHGDTGIAAGLYFRFNLTYYGS